MKESTYIHLSVFHTLNQKKHIIIIFFFLLKIKKYLDTQCFPSYSFIYALNRELHLVYSFYYSPLNIFFSFTSHPLKNLCVNTQIQGREKCTLIEDEREQSLRNKKKNKGKKNTTKNKEINYKSVFQECEKKKNIKAILSFSVLIAIKNVF